MGVLDWLRGRPRPVVAAAQVVNNRQQLESGYSSQTREVSEAWRVWRCVGEIHYATTQQARLISRLEWNLEIEGEPVEEDQRDAVFQLAFGKDMPELARQAALHLQVAGGYYLARVDEPNDWDVLPMPANYKVQQQLDKADVVIRVTNPDPVEPSMTDSPVLAALDVARELILARAQARSASRNRTAQLQTVLYPLEGVQDVEKFEREFNEVITAPIADEKSSSAVVPNLIGFAAEYIDKWKTLDLTGPIEEKLHQKIVGLVRQLAVILDNPPEILTGMGETNHWSQWAIQEDNWLGHVEPSAKVIGNGFAAALAEATDLQASMIDIVPNPAPLLKRRPSLQDALDGFKAGIVSAQWAREQLGASEEDAPEPSEAPAPAPGPQTEPEAVEEPTEPQTAALSAHARIREFMALTAAPQLPFSNDRLLAIDQQLYDSLEDSLGLAISRVLEKVGGQLRSKIQGDPESKKKYADTPNSELPTTDLDYQSLPNLDKTITDALESVLAASFPRMVDRAVQDTRSAGVLIEKDQRAQDDAYEVLSSEAFEIAGVALSGEATEGYSHVLIRRALTIAGGGTDPVPEPETAAPRKRLAIPDPKDGAGIALGRGAIQWVEDKLGQRPRAYIWEHVGGSGNDHPAHSSFDGVEFDGKSYDDGSGIVWFPGDHAGCRCRRVPVWEETP